MVVTSNRPLVASNRTAHSNEQLWSCGFDCCRTQNGQLCKKPSAPPRTKELPERRYRHPTHGPIGTSGRWMEANVLGAPCRGGGGGGEAGGELLPRRSRRRIAAKTGRGYVFIFYFVKQKGFANSHRHPTHRPGDTQHTDQGTRSTQARGYRLPGDTQVYRCVGLGLDNGQRVCSTGCWLAPGRP
jgi:hypothetical protein